MSSPSHSQSAAAMKSNRQSTVAFADGTKGSRNNRESQAWAGMMTGNLSSDDSDSDDSDDERLAKVPAVPSSSAAKSPARASWSSRAAAVGSRPPDSASQNPPSLKLLGLKSAKEGGAPMGNYGSQSPNHLTTQQTRDRTPSPSFDMVAEQVRHSPQKDRIISTSDYGDELDRHGSYIDFGGADGFGGGRESKSVARGYQLEDGPVNPASSSLEPPRSPNVQPLSPRTALTHQLGLITPRPSQEHPPPPSPNQPTRPVEQESYFPPVMPNASSRNLMPGGTQMQQQQQRQQPPRGLAPISVPPPVQNVPLQRGQPAPGYPSPQHQGPPPMIGQTRNAPGPAPVPVSLPSPVYPQSGAQMMANPPSYGGGRPSQDNRFGPPPGPGFSDSPQVGGRGQMGRKPSLLRRSMAFISGSDAQQSYPSQQQPGRPNNSQRKSLFRRSMAFLSGRPMPAPIQQQQEQQPDGLSTDDDADAPQPRVRGFVDEKPKNRKSEYLGASGMGDEWDYSGYGAKFWKRFSVAQRKESEGANKDSEAFRRKMEKRRRYIMCMSLFGGVIIIGAVVAVVIWRESVQSSDIPGAVDREHNGVNAASQSGGVNVNANSASEDDTTYTSQTDYGTTEAVRATTTTKKHHHHKNTNNRREMLATMGVADVIKRQVEGVSPYYGGIHPLPRGLDTQMIRRRRHTERSLEAQITPAPHAST